MTKVIPPGRNDIRSAAELCLHGCRIEAGVAATESDVLFRVEGSLIDLTAVEFEHHLEQLARPVICSASVVDSRSLAVRLGPYSGKLPQRLDLRRLLTRGAPFVAVASRGVEVRACSVDVVELWLRDFLHQNLALGAGAASDSFADDYRSRMEELGASALVVLAKMGSVKRR
ncbi:MAG: hypothetical protein IT361_11925 [Gemmatimonadaceae bacterium]|nr:hypothetical protein [Gemmatimonadaceae bacterium]